MSILGIRNGLRRVTKACYVAKADDATICRAARDWRAAVRAALARILGSSEFERSGRVRQMLEFLVETTLAGGAVNLKESVIANRIFERDPSYDPKNDPVVRVTAGRLRAKLDLYYGRAGRFDPLRIEIQKGTYVPTFRTATPALPLTMAEPEIISPSRAGVPHGRTWAWIGAAALVAIGLSIFATTRPKAPSLQGVRVLFAGGGQPLHPSISPAGDMIAFDWAGPEDSHNAIYVQRMDGHFAYPADARQADRGHGPSGRPTGSRSRSCDTSPRIASQ